MPTNVICPRVQRSKDSMSPNAMMPLALVLLAFAILHVMGAVMLQRMSATLPTEDPTFTVHGD